MTTTMFIRLVFLACALAFVHGFGSPDLVIGGIEYSYGIAVDTTNQVLYVADTKNSRILIWHDIPSLTDASLPDTVFGQPDLKTTTGGVDRNKLYHPGGLFVDDQGTLWAADSANRVLYWKNAHTLGNGANATGVVGQQDFVSFESGLGLSNFNYPAGVWVYQGSLFVTDSNQFRVLRFDGIYQDDFPTVGATGSAVYGQPNATVALSFGATQSSWDNVYFTCVDSNGLYVPDSEDHRVLYFPSSELEKSGTVTASFVLGQPNFNTSRGNNPSLSASSLYYPYGCFGTGEYLFIADNSNARVLMFEEPITANQQAAVAVFGPFTFTSNTNDYSSLLNPFAIFFDETTGALWVGDSASASVKRFSKVLAPSTDFSTDLVNIKLGSAAPKASLNPVGSKATLDIKLISFEEITSKGSVVQTIDVPKGGYKVSSSQSSTSNSITYFILLSNGAKASSTFSAFNSSDSLDFAGVAFSVKAGMIKFDFSLSGWDWQSSSNTLNATIRFSSSSNHTTINTPSNSSGVTTFTLNSSDEVITTLQLINAGLVDGKAEEIGLSVSQTDDTTIDLVISIPHFSSTFEYDPQVAVEKTSSPAARSQASWVSLLSVLAAAFL